MPSAETAIITGNNMNMGLRIIPVRIITTTMPTTATTRTMGSTICTSGLGVGRGRAGGAWSAICPCGTGGAASFSARVNTTSPMTVPLACCFLDCAYCLVVCAGLRPPPRRPSRRCHIDCPADGREMTPP